MGDTRGHIPQKGLVPARVGAELLRLALASGRTAEGNAALGEVAGFAAIAAVVPVILVLASLVLVLEAVTLL
jgi:hypothetical protein